MNVSVRDAVESDAEALAALAGIPTDVARNLVHDRTVRVAVDDGEVVGVVSFDAHRDAVHVTQIGGDEAVCERLLAEPIPFAEREGMSVELLVPESEATVRAAAERAGYEHRGEGPPFDGERTVRYRRSP